MTWSEDSVISSTTETTKLKITDIKLYVLAVTLSKLWRQLKSGFKRTINWSKYLTKILTKRQNQYLDFLIDPSFQGLNRLFALSFENQSLRKVHTGYFLPKVEIKDPNVTIDEKTFWSAS